MANGGNSRGRQPANGGRPPPELDKWISYIQVFAMGATLISGRLTGVPWVPVVVLTIVVATCVYAFFTLRKLNKAPKRNRNNPWPNRLNWAFFLLILGLVFVICYMSNSANGTLSGQSIVEPPRDQRLYTKPFATLDELSKERIENRTVFLADFIKIVPSDQQYLRAPAIRAKVLENCDVYGPSFVSGIKTDLIDCEFTYTRTLGEWTRVDAETVMLPLPPVALDGLAGTLALDNCLFRNCTFTGVTLAGTDGQIAKWRQNLARIHLDGVTEVRGN